MKQPQQPEEDFEGDGEVKPAGGKLKRYLIIGGVVALLIIAIAVPASLKNSGSSEASPVTIESVNTKVNALEAWKSATDESLSGLWEKANSIQNTVNSLKSPKDWTSEINIIKGNITALRDIVDDIDITDYPPAIMDALSSIFDRLDVLEDTIGESFNVTIDSAFDITVEEDAVVIMVYETGSYPIVITLYGNGLEPDKVAKWPSESYNITRKWGLNVTSGAVISIIAEGEWETGDEIGLWATEGKVDYVVVAKGGAS